MINSTSNKQVKRVINLRDKAKARREEGLYVAEGLRMCREYKPDDVEILYITENFGKQEENKKWLRGFKFEFVTDEVMHYMADTKTPQGVLAVAKQKKCTLEDILKKTKTQKLLMILENIQDPGNLGTIIRAGEGRYYRCGHEQRYSGYLQSKGDPFYYGICAACTICVCL